MGSKDRSQILAEFAGSGQEFTTDTIETRDGHQLTIVFFSHATLGFVWDDKVVYVDPLMEYADFSKLPKADLVLVTHDHYDHLDGKAIDAVMREGTVVIGSGSVADEYAKARRMKPGDSMDAVAGISVDAVHAYNVSEHQLQFHPKEKAYNGYVINFADTRVYVAGDTEPVPEMKRLHDKVDVMFLPVNQPYTMTPEQAAYAARMVNAPVLYPYHTGDTEIRLVEELLSDTPSITVKIFPME